MNTTYFGCNFDVMVFKDSLSGTVLYLNFVKHESLLLYKEEISEISRRGIKMQSNNIVISKICYTFAPSFMQTWAGQSWSETGKVCAPNRTPIKRN
jgi:hypothetical protein